MNSSHRTIICCYEMLHISFAVLLHLQIAKYKGFLIQILVFTCFSAKTVLKDFNKIKGFLKVVKVPLGALEMAISVDLDQTAPLGAV